MVPDVNAEFAEMTQTAANTAGEHETGEPIPATQPAEQPVTDDPSPVSAPEPDSDIEHDSKPSEPAETDNVMVYNKPVVQQSAPSPSPVPQKTQPAIPQAAEPVVKIKIMATPEEPATSPMAGQNSLSDDKQGKREETDRMADEMAEQKRLTAEKKYQEQIVRELEQRANAESLKKQKAAAAEKARQEEVQLKNLHQE
jgi:hypothetical protein